MSIGNERVLYLNGEIVPESRGLVHFRDLGFTHGDAVFDTARTFAGRLYRLEEHIERLFKSLRYVQIDPGLDRSELIAISRDVAERNRHLLGENEDYWVFQRITRGNRSPDGPYQDAGPTVIVETTPLPLAERATLFRDGVDVIVPTHRRVPPEAMSPNAKTHNYLNFVMAALERPAVPGQWPILLDTRGFMSEGSGSNFFIVRDGEVLTPRAEYVLAGISRKVILELCVREGIPARECDISLFDAATADEMFISSTSLCLVWASAFNGRPVGEGGAPGPVTERLIEAYKADIGHDFVAQYLAHLPS